MNEATTSPLVAQVAATTEVIIANGWCDRGRVERAIAAAASTAEPLPTAGRSRVAQFLIDQRVLSREQAVDLDSIMRSQANLPGFRLLRKIGSGGMGVVYLATHIVSGRCCALKTLNTRLAKEEDFISRFHREAQALSGLKHPNIAEVIESGECDGSCYLAMEFIDGPSAMDLLRDYAALPEAYSLRIIKQIADGLSYVYSQSNLVHRDLKPENILIIRNPSANGELFGDNDIAKLIDFGLVKSTSEDDQRLTQTGMTIGTPLYMSPEQVRGEALDARSDIYGLGATLYHLLTGSTPYTGTSPGAIMSAHLTEAIPDPGVRVPSLSSETRRIVMTAMAKNPNDRFRNYDALVTACMEAIGDVTGKGEGAPKLLLKPLVLKNLRKPDTTRVASGASPIPPPPGKGEITSRIIAKHKQLQSAAAAGDGKIDGRQLVALPVLPVIAGSEAAAPVAAAAPVVAHAPATAKAPAAAEAMPSDAPSREPSGAVVASAPPPVRSAPERAARVQHKPPPLVIADPDMLAEARDAAGQANRVGWMPILALAIALIALAAYLIWR